MNLIKQIIEEIFLGEKASTSYTLQTISKEKQKKNHLKREIEILRHELEQEKKSVKMLKRQVKNLNRTFFNTDET